MIWFETLTNRYFYSTEKEVRTFVHSEMCLGDVLDFLEKHNLQRCGYVCTLDPTTKVSISIVGSTLIITI